MFQYISETCMFLKTNTCVRYIQKMYMYKFFKNCLNTSKTNKQTKTEIQQRSLTELLHMYICLSLFIENRN